MFASRRSCRAAVGIGPKLACWLIAARATALPASDPGTNPAGGAVALSWEPPDGAHDCMSADELRKAVHHELGRDVFRPVPAEATIRVRIERVEPTPAWRATVALENAGGRVWGRRQLDAPGRSCRVLDEPLVLAVTLMVDTELLQPPTETPEAEPEPEPEPEPERPRTPSRPAKALPRETSTPPDADALAPVLTVPSLQAGTESKSWTFAADGAAVGAIGVLPGPALGFEIGVGLEPPRFVHVRGHAVAFLPRTRDLEQTAFTSFELAYAGLALCPELHRTRLSLLSFCLGADVGRIKAESRGLEGAREVRRLLVQTSAGGRASWALGGPWRIGASATLLFPLEPEVFVYRRADGREAELFQMSYVSAVVGLGGGMEFR